MFATDVRSSGIETVGDVPWGTNLCQLYRTADDLADCVVPYLGAGLAGGEQCLWAAPAALGVEGARALLRAAAPTLEARVAAADLEIVDERAFADEGCPVGACLEREQRALARGGAGLRVARGAHRGDRGAREALRSRRVLSLCSRDLRGCAPEDVIAIARDHDLTLARYDGGWDTVEGPSLRAARDERRTSHEHTLRVRDEFLEVASHELKTPIASFKLYVEGIRRAHRRGALSAEDIDHRLGKAVAQCQRLETLVGRLLQACRATATGSMAVLPQEMDLAELCRASVDRFRRIFERAGCAVEVDADRPVLGSWDPTLLSEVFANLFSNAVKYGPGRPVRVTVREDGALAVVRVLDQGVGIARSDSGRIFERYTRLSPQQHPGGFGLGLWMVRQIVESSGGEIQVTSKEGEGSTFTITLPRSNRVSASELPCPRPS